jgi:hypothetical protein
VEWTILLYHVHQSIGGWPKRLVHSIWKSVVEAGLSVVDENIHFFGLEISEGVRIRREELSNELYGFAATTQSFLIIVIALRITFWANPGLFLIMVCNIH